MSFANNVNVIIHNSPTNHTQCPTLLRYLSHLLGKRVVSTQKKKEEQTLSLARGSQFDLYCIFWNYLSFTRRLDAVTVLITVSGTRWVLWPLVWMKSSWLQAQTTVEKAEETCTKRLHAMAEDHKKQLGAGWKTTGKPWGNHGQTMVAPPEDRNCSKWFGWS